MFLKNRNISSKIKRSKVTDYAALIINKTPYRWPTHELSVLIASGKAGKVQASLMRGSRKLFSEGSKFFFS